MIGHEKLVQRLEKPEFKVGIFSAGDLIALAGIVFMSGALWIQVMRNGSDLREVRAEDSALQSRIAIVEQSLPSNYVQRQEYREDTKEIKDILERIETKLDKKADK